MRPFPLFFVLVYLFLLVTAAPTSSSSSSSSTISTHNSSSTGTSPLATGTSHTSHKTSSTRIPRPQSGTTTQQFLTRPGASTPTHTRSIIPDIPVHTRNPFQNPHRHPPHGQKPISIVFEVLGGLAATALLLGFIRCFHNYRKTPGRDRIADILQRHQLQRELDELERNPGLLRRHASIREPAPPYFPRPPSYEHVPPSMAPVSITSRERYPQVEDRAQYSPVATHSPPSTPPMNERILLPTPAATHATHPGQLT